MSTLPAQPSTRMDPLHDRVINALQRLPAQKADDLSRSLHAPVDEVLKCLTVLQGIIVQQDPLYRWSLIEPGEQVHGSHAGVAHLRAEISRLNQYYLNCLGQDSDTGVSVFSKSVHGPLDYAELKRHPLVGAPEPWWNEPDAQRVLNAVRADKRNQEAWVGYPVQLRKHKTPTWEGYFVEPVLLWRVVFPDEAGQGFKLEDGLPQLNFSFLRSIAMGGASEVVEEAAALGTELGLNNQPKDQPTAKELLLRMFSLRPEWDWAEPLEPTQASEGPPLSELTEAGIYNRVVVVPSKRSPYTQGLESELKALTLTHPVDFLGTALDQWFHGQLAPLQDVDVDAEDLPLIEVLPMNSEQRAAVQSALTEPLTVVTGPPGTGKSQVVTNLLVNAAWRGMRVLFASKNNKAVDVVEARVNNLGARPVLLRLGSADYQNRLSRYFSAMLSGQVGPEEVFSYRERLARHAELSRQATVLDQLQAQTMATRNHADKLDSEVDGYRKLIGNAQFAAISDDLLEVGSAKLLQFLDVLDGFNPEHASLFDKLFGFLFKNARTARLVDKFEQLAPLAQELGANELAAQQEVGFEDLQEFARSVSERLEAAQVVLTYKSALDALLTCPPLEAIAQHQLDVTAQIAQNSTGLWKDWVNLLPSRLSASERTDVAEYASLLQALNDPASKNTSAGVRQRAYALQQKVTSLFSCWAVTSLSVRGKVPLEPGYFDLVVIDEASQCDIASAIPLLFRAKRAVIIGDPLQLRHISALSPAKDLEFWERLGLAQTRASWLYSVNSLYDLAAGIAAPDDIVNLRDHHRSHADIIEFSNKAFYSGRLRVATRHSQLLPPAQSVGGVMWTDVEGDCIRPPEGGLRNLSEAQAVVQVLKDLLLDNRYPGSVGVVTPFRAQAVLIQRLLAGHPEMAEAAARCDLLIDTVHRFQGDERDVIVFSPVIGRSTPASAIAFLRNNPNLFNVGITRAKALLHVVGSIAALQASGVEHLEGFTKYVQTLALPALAAPAPKTMGPEYPVVARPAQVSGWERELYAALHAAGIAALPQFTVEQYDLDFAVFNGSRKLNIEVDGGEYHKDWTAETCLREQLRCQRLIELGWNVKRFWVYEIKDRLPECVEQVQEWLRRPGA